MDLYTLLKSAGYGTEGITNSPVEYITDDNRKVKSGSVFVCIKGNHFDGHTVAGECVSAGAVLIVCEKNPGVPNALVVPDTREALSLLCEAFFGHPADKLSLIGITGTNGKTTTAFLIKSILDDCGYKTGLIGTVKNLIGEKAYPAALTTPSPFELNELFSEMVRSGCKYCVMEVSSQALSQKRVAGLRFDIAAFTNLTQDHLDYHGTFENYALAKKMLFSQCDTAVVNRDDPYSAFMTEGSDCKVVSFSVKTSDGDFFAKDIAYSSKGIEYLLTGEGKDCKISVGIPGEFTVYNSMCAFVCVLCAGIPAEKAADSLARAKGVPGRIEVVPTDTEYTVVIDYSHTPDALENILSSLRKITQGRLIAVFGCGGDRDAGKRPKMGKIAAEMADYVVVTSDNPRSEDPDKIVEQVAAGAEGTQTPLVKIVDRTQAIEFAMRNARKGDVILLAGKGHETYQILNTGKIHYDEREVVQNILRSF